MRSLFKDLICAFKQMNKISRIYIFWCSPFVFTSAVLGFFCAVFAGVIGIYDNMMILSAELFALFKELVGAVYIPALIIEIVMLASKLK